MVSKAFENFYENSLKPAMPKLENVEIKDGKIKTPGGADIELKSKDGKICRRQQTGRAGFCF